MHFSNADLVQAASKDVKAVAGACQALRQALIPQPRLLELLDFTLLKVLQQSTVQVTQVLPLTIHHMLHKSSGADSRATIVMAKGCRGLLAGSPAGNFVAMQDTAFRD